MGAGINGLWIAWRFLRAGWQVTLADAGPLPNPAAAS
ncbi:FAD-dependent oxidoreductase, partial [Escherichia coli]